VTVTDSSTAPTSSFEIEAEMLVDAERDVRDGDRLEARELGLHGILPVGSDGAVYSPSASVVTERTWPVSVLVNVTVVPGITAPLGISYELRGFVPVTACAARRPEGSNALTT
jgi:hypothetical protein